MKLTAMSRQPFLGVALTAIAAIGISDFVPLSQRTVITALALIGISATLLICRPNLIGTYLFVFAGFFLLHVLQTSATAGLSLASLLGERPRMITATGAVVSEPRLLPNGKAVFLMQLSNVELEGVTRPTGATIQVRWKGKPSLGDELQLFGMAAPIAPPRNPGEFDMRSYLVRRDVHRALFVHYPEEGVLLRAGGGNPILSLAQRSRNWLQSTLCRGLDDSPEVKDFISGITLGLRHQTPEDIEEPFQQTGTLHLFAVAGLHVGIVAQLLWLVGSVVGVSRRWAAAAIIPMVLFYSAVTGLHISSVRAAIMSAVFMGGYVVERKPFTLNSLSAAAVILLAWNTNELFSTGFQLSFAVVGAIVLLVDPVTALLRRPTAPDPFLPRQLLSKSRRLTDPVLLKVTQNVSVSVAAFVGSLVLLFWYFHLVTPVSLVANAVVVPIAYAILAVALLSILAAAALPGFSLIFNNTNWFLAKLVIGIVHVFAQLPAGHHYLPHPPGLGSAKAKLTVLDLGAGAAVHLQTRNRDWLFDCGSQRDYDRLVREYLHTAGVNRIGALLLSHGDAQHIGGASKLLLEMPPALLIDNPAPDRSSIHKRLRHLYDERALRVIRPVRGESFAPAEEVRCTVLHPPRNFSASMGDDQALVLQLQFQSGPTVLLMSDSGVATEKALLESASNVRSDILIKGQHHSGVSGSVDFVRAVQPQLIVATSCDFPRHERIDDQWADDLREKDVRLFRQDQTGAVEIRFWSDRWEARGFANGETFRSSNR